MKGIYYAIFPPKTLKAVLKYASYLEKSKQLKKAYEILYEFFCAEEGEKNFALGNNLGYYAVQLFRKSRDTNYLVVAERAYACAAVFEPDNKLLLYNVLEYSMQLYDRDYQSAARCIDKLIEEKKKDFRFNLDAGYIYIFVGRNEAALECLQRAEKLAVKIEIDLWDEINLLFALAFAYKEEKVYTKALNYIKKLEKLFNHITVGIIEQCLLENFSELYGQICQLAKDDSVNSNNDHGQEFDPDNN